MYLGNSSQFGGDLKKFKLAAQIIIPESAGKVGSGKKGLKNAPRILISCVGHQPI
jgi:hypothetical protein